LSSGGTYSAGPGDSDWLYLLGYSLCKCKLEICPNVLGNMSLPDSTPQGHAAVIPGSTFYHYVHTVHPLLSDACFLFLQHFSNCIRTVGSNGRESNNEEAKSKRVANLRQRFRTYQSTQWLDSLLPGNGSKLGTIPPQKKTPRSMTLRSVNMPSGIVWVHKQRRNLLWSW
jgi:hypothetical protein